MAVSKRTRYEVLRRDNHACRYCGAMAPEAKLTIDHVVPVALGGSDDPGNLVAACRDCNAGKTSVAPDQAVVEDVTADAIRWADAMKRAAALLAEQAKPELEYAEQFENLWSTYTYGPEWDRKPVPLDSGWRQSLIGFYRSELPRVQMIRAVEIAMSKQSVRAEGTFRYFCGICWRMLDEQRAAAKALIEAEEADSGA